MMSPQIHAALTHVRTEEIARKAERRRAAAVKPAPVVEVRSTGLMRKSLARLRLAPLH